MAINLNGGKGQGPFGTGELFGITCSTDAVLIGLAAGTAVGFHRYRGVRQIVPAFDWGIKMMCVTSLASFGFCRTRYHEAHAELQEKLKRLKEQKKKLARANEDET